MQTKPNQKAIITLSKKGTKPEPVAMPNIVHHPTKVVTINLINASIKWKAQLPPYYELLDSTPVLSQPH